MKKIRIPRKKKKLSYWLGIERCKYYPYITKAEKYFSYLNVESFSKKRGYVPEDLYRMYGRFVMDDIIWYHWVRKKHFGIEPKMSQDFQEYWDYFVKKGVIKF